VSNPLGTYGFLRKKNQIKNDEIIRYKAQLVAQGFSQNPILICEKTYSLVLDATVRNKAIKERIKKRKIDTENLTWFGVQCVCLCPRLH